MTRKRYLMASVGVIAAIAVLSIQAQQDGAQKKDPSQKETNSTRDQKSDGGWEKFTRPTEHHKKLAPLVGKWALVVKQPQDNSDKWVETRGTAEFRWAMEGRYLIEESRTSWENKPFEWMGIHGYDIGKGCYVSAWIDNLGTGIDQMEGTMDSAGKTITYTGDLKGPGGAQPTVKWVMTIESDKKFTVRMLVVAGHQEMKAMDIVGHRE